MASPMHALSTWHSVSPAYHRVLSTQSRKRLYPVLLWTSRPDGHRCISITIQGQVVMSVISVTSETSSSKNLLQHRPVSLKVHSDYCTNGTLWNVRNAQSRASGRLFLCPSSEKLRTGTDSLISLSYMKQCVNEYYGRHM
jgi:hypothetical protein